MEPSPKRVKLSSSAGDFVCDANEVIKFHVVDHNKDSLEAEIQEGGRVFQPMMCHQHFGEQEEIKGYTGILIDIWLSARTYHTWIDVNFTHKRATADDVMDAFVDNFPGGYAVDKHQYLQTLQRCSIPDVFELGTTLSNTTMTDGSELRIQLHQLATADSLIKELHVRMEALILFFIDAASFVEKDDPNWHLLLAVKRCNGHDLVVGFATVYKFFAFPDRNRLRLSQILVLPPFQGQGVGRHLLQAAYKMAADENATDLTLEDPTEDLLRIREKVDLQRMAALPWLRELAQKTAAAASSLPAAPASSDNGGGLIRSATQKRHPLALASPDISRVQEESKIHKASVKALWEVLLVAELQASQSGGRALESVKELVAWRLRSMYMGSSSTATADGKVVLESGLEGVFDLIRVTAKQEGKQSAAASGNGTMQVGGGRGITEVAAEDVEKELEELLEKRMERLHELAETLS